MSSPACLTDTLATLPSRTCCSQRAMSAAESARDARVTRTAARVLLLVLHGAAAAAGTIRVTCTILGRMGHTAACLLLAAAAAEVAWDATSAIVKLRKRHYKNQGRAVGIC